MSLEEGNRAKERFEILLEGLRGYKVDFVIKGRTKDRASHTSVIILMN